MDEMKTVTILIGQDIPKITSMAILIFWTTMVFACRIEVRPC